jgi:hypothetical protein
MACRHSHQKCELGGKKKSTESGSKKRRQGTNRLPCLCLSLFSFYNIYLLTIFCLTASPTPPAGLSLKKSKQDLTSSTLPSRSYSRGSSSRRGSRKEKARASADMSDGEEEVQTILMGPGTSGHGSQGNKDDTRREIDDIRSYLTRLVEGETARLELARKVMTDALQNMSCTLGALHGSVDAMYYMLANENGGISQGTLNQIRESLDGLGNLASEEGVETRQSPEV